MCFDAGLRGSGATYSRSVFVGVDLAPLLNIMTARVSPACSYTSVVEPAEARADGPHKPGVHRGQVDGKWPPGVTCNYAAPENASPFVQAHLPQGMKFENKRSKSVSFVSEHGPRGRGTSKTREAAEAAVMSWAWRWFNSLNQESQNAIHRCATNKRTGGEQLAPAKRPKAS